MTAHRDNPASPGGERRRLLLKHATLGLGALAAGPVAGFAHAIAADEPFWFGFIGDTPYSRLEENALHKVLDALSVEPLEFVLHVGDIKSSGETCGDELLASRLALFGECAHPLILTPGDNDWTDCNRSLGPWQPGGRLERLDWLRRHAYGSPRSLGMRTMALQQQGRHIAQPIAAAREPAALVGARPAKPSGAAIGAHAPEALQAPGLPENLRWRVGSLQFCTLHVVGSNNAPRNSPELASAWLLRQEANGAWLNETVEMAIRQQAKGLAIALHANMRFEDDRSDGWERMRQLIIAAAVAFKGPVLLLHGDTHHFRTDRLLLRSHGLANFQRVECFGSPFSSSWVQIRWNPALASAESMSRGSSPFQVSTRSLP